MAARVDLSAYAGKVLLIVNTASKCGFTPQYEGLEALHRDYADRGFEVLGFPCNQFGAQEPGDAAEIASFCSLTYDVTFPVFAKIDVNGDDADPLFERLKARGAGAAGIEGDQVELHQVPGRSQRQGRSRAMRRRPSPRRSRRISRSCCNGSAGSRTRRVALAVMRPRRFDLDAVRPSRKLIPRM